MCCRRRRRLRWLQTYRGPHEVVKRADKFFILKIGGLFQAVTVDHLKPYLGGPPRPPLPLKGGRPPKRTGV
jgi:hypothetical protein